MKKLGVFVCILVISAGLTGIFTENSKVEIKYDKQEFNFIINTKNYYPFDELDDLVYVEETEFACSFYWRDQEGNAHLINHYPSFPLPSCFAANGKWDGNGIDDYLYTVDKPNGCYSNVYIKEAEGETKTWTNKRILFIDFGDWDGDGKDEILFRDTTSDNTKWRNQNGAIHEITDDPTFGTVYYFVSFVAGKGFVGMYGGVSQFPKSMNRIRI